MTRLFRSHEPRLPFPTRPLEVKWGTIVEEYIVPDEHKTTVLRQLYAGPTVPELHRTMTDSQDGRTFRVRDFRVIRVAGTNAIVSPYYPESGGTAGDWK